jgi:hypothetical protein
LISFRLSRYFHTKCWNVCWLKPRPFKFLSVFRCSAEPFILGELRYNTTSGGWRKKKEERYTSIFYRNKTFLFVEIESWNFQQLFNFEFRETLQNFSSFRQHLDDIYLWVIRGVRISWNFVKFHEMINQRDAENFSFLSLQTKKFYS